MDKPEGERLLTGKERIAIWEQYKSEHPNPELIPDSDFGYVQRLLKAQLTKAKMEALIDKETQMNKKLDEKIDADEDVANLNYLNGKRDGIKQILDKIGKDYTNQDGWISIPMLNWREIRKQHRKTE